MPCLCVVVLGSQFSSFATACSVGIQWKTVASVASMAHGICVKGSQRPRQIDAPQVFSRTVPMDMSTNSDSRHFHWKTGIVDFSLGFFTLCVTSLAIQRGFPRQYSSAIFQTDSWKLAVRLPALALNIRRVRKAKSRVPARRDRLAKWILEFCFFFIGAF